MAYFDDRNGHDNPLPPVLKVGPRRGTNPAFTIEQFTVYIPEMAWFLATEKGIQMFNTYKPIADQKVYHIAWGPEWEYGMSLCIAHYIKLWAVGASQSDNGRDTTMTGLASLGQPRGMITSLSVGGVSKSYDFTNTVVAKGADSAFWNRTDYGQLFYALLFVKTPFALGVAS